MCDQVVDVSNLTSFSNVPRFDGAVARILEVQVLCLQCSGYKPGGSCSPCEGDRSSIVKPSPKGSASRPSSPTKLTGRVGLRGLVLGVSDQWQGEKEPDILDRDVREQLLQGRRS